MAELFQRDVGIGIDGGALVDGLVVGGEVAREPGLDGGTHRRELLVVAGGDGRRCGPQRLELRPEPAYDA